MAVKFATDDPRRDMDTGAGDGRAPNIPLSSGPGSTAVEMLSQGQDEDGEGKAEQQQPVERRRRPTQDEAQANQNAAVKATFDPDADEDNDDTDVDAPAYARERVGARIGIPPEEAAKVGEIETTLDGEDRVPMMFPREVRLNDRGLMHIWGAGLHMVPVSIGGVNRKDKGMHFYLKHHGVRHAGSVVKGQPIREDA